MDVKERRRETRRTVELHANISQPGNGTAIEGIVQNASGEGCQIVSDNLDKLADATIVMNIAGFNDAMSARIVWREGNRCGVAFIR
jgi:hypothetical protein